MPDDIQLTLIKQTISDAKDSKDQNRILDALSAGLVATMECTSHTSAVIRSTAKSVEEIKTTIRDVLGMEERLKKLEMKFLQYEERGKGAGWVMKILVGSGLLTGGAIIGCLPRIIESLLGAM